MAASQSFDPTGRPTLSALRKAASVSASSKSSPQIPVKQYQ
jgi:hypothetical protein